MNRKLTMLAAAILSLAACTQQAKPRYIWIDASANFSDFANSKENIERDIIKAKEAGFTSCTALDAFSTKSWMTLARNSRKFL